jgi:hypothetical protein
MAETLLFYLEVQKYDKQKKRENKAEMANVIFQRFFDLSSGYSHDILTLAADQTQLVEERIASQAYDGLFREVIIIIIFFFFAKSFLKICVLKAQMEVLLQMRSNALVDFLASLPNE